MIQAIAIAVQIAALTVGAINAAAEPSITDEGLQIDGTLDAIGNHELIEAIISAAPTTNWGETAIEPAAAHADSGWMDEVQSGIGYPVTQTISLGVAYAHEQIEDLTAQYIEMGTAGVDYTSHKVLVRANWQFDIVPNLF